MIIIRAFQSVLFLFWMVKVMQYIPAEVCGTWIDPFAWEELMMSSLKEGKWVHNWAASEQHERGLLCVMCELISLLLYALL